MERHKKDFHSGTGKERRKSQVSAASPTLPKAEGRSSVVEKDAPADVLPPEKANEKG